MSFDDVFPTPYNFTFSCDELEFYVSIVDRDNVTREVNYNGQTLVAKTKHSFYDGRTNSIRDFIVNVPSHVSSLFIDDMTKQILRETPVAPIANTIPVGLEDRIRNSVFDGIYRNIKLDNKLIYDHIMTIEVPVNGRYSITGRLRFSGTEIFSKIMLNELDLDGEITKMEHRVIVNGALELSDAHCGDNVDDADSLDVDVRLSFDGERDTDIHHYKNSLEVAMHIFSEGIDKIEEHFSGNLDDSVEGWDPTFGASKAFSRLDGIIGAFDLSESPNASHFSYAEYFPRDSIADLLERQDKKFKVQMAKEITKLEHELSDVVREANRKCEELRDNSVYTPLDTIIKKNGEILKAANARKVIIRNASRKRISNLRENHNKSLEGLGLGPRNKVGGGGGIEKKN